MPVCIALLRGINVGKAKRIAMADLRGLLEALGHGQVKTLLNSGNAVFEANFKKGRSEAQELSRIAAEICAAVQAHAGFHSEVIVISGQTLREAMQDNPFPAAAAQASQFLLAFAPDADSLAALAPLQAQDWSPDQFALGQQAAYLWCSGGILESRLAKELLRQGMCTTRNWATLGKLLELLNPAKAVPG